MPNTGNRKHGRTLPAKSLKPLSQEYSRNDKFFAWSFKKCFWNHYGWQKNCSGVQFFAEHIIAKLQEFEKRKWQEILGDSGGKSEGNGNNHHFILAKKMRKSEWKEFVDREDLREYSRVFSLRLTGKERLIGVVYLNEFQILWFDADHEIFPAPK